MKKNLFALLSIATILLAGCTDTQEVKIDVENIAPEELSEIEQTFNAQINEAQYIKDLEDFISYNISLDTEEKPFVSNILFDANFDENSSVQGGLEFSRKNTLKTKDLGSIDITFDLEAKQGSSDPEPVYSSGDVTLLYQNDKMYAYLRNFGVFMGEGNMTAKMYTLLLDMVKDQWVDLEASEGGIISINKDDNTDISNIIGTLKNILETKDIQSNQTFSSNIAEMIDTINSRIDLGISTDELTLLSQKIEYFELSDESIQKGFTGSFQGSQSAFDLSFKASKNGLDVHIYNIKEYDEDIQDYRDVESEFYLSIQENKKSDYSVAFQSTKYRQKVVDLQGEIKYSDAADFSADFVLEPLEIMAGQKISGDIKGSIKKQELKGNESFPELSGEIISINEILSSL